MDAGAVQLELVLTGYKEVERQLAKIGKSGNIEVGNPFEAWEKAAARAAKEANKAKRMAARGDNKTNFEIAGIKITNRQLKQLRIQARLTSRSVRKSFGQMEAATDGFRSALGSGLARFVGFTAIAYGLQDVIRKTIKFEQATTLLNRTLGDAGPVATQFVRGLVNEVGGSLSQTALDFAKFSAAANAAGIELSLQKEVFKQTAVAALAFGLSTEQSKRSLQALQQIAAKGVVSMEEVRQQLGEQLPVAIAAAAKGAGVSMAELISMISSGTYKSEEFFKAYAKGMKEFNQGAAGADTAQVAFRKFQGSLEDLQVEFGKGVLPSITEGVKGLTVAMKGLGLSLRATKVSGGDGLLGLLGIQGFASQQITGWQEALLARGTLTESEVNALITDSVKDVEGKVYNALGRINIDPTNATSIYDKLFEKVLEYEEKVKGRTNGNAETAEAARLLKLEEERIKKLALTNEELKRSEKLALAQGKALYGPETLRIVEAQIKLAQAQREAALFADPTTNAAKDAANAQLVAAEEAAQTIKDAYKEARDAAGDAADALGEARSKRANQLFDRKSGINQFLGGTALRSRQREGIKLQVAEAARLRKALVESFKKSGNTAAARQIGNVRFRGNTQERFAQRQKFIEAAREELYGQKALITANENLTKAMADLNTTIIKGFDGGSQAQREDFKALKESIDTLTKKEWTVGVDARLNGDGTINVQNALS